MTHGEFWSKVTIICHMFDCRGTSGPRSVRWNKEVGGVANGFHLIGLAIDLAGYKSTDVKAIKEYAARVGLLAIDEEDHIHVQPSKG